jgi:glycine/D-amino acid oxidase-like deaminating enzyme
MGAVVYSDIIAVESQSLYRAMFEASESDGRISTCWGVKALGLDVKNGRAVGLRSSMGPIPAGAFLLASGIGTMGIFASTGIQMPPVPERTHRLVGQSIDSGPNRLVTEYLLPGPFAYQSGTQEEESGFYVKLSAWVSAGREASVGEAREFVFVDNNGPSNRGALNAISRRFSTRMPGYANLVFDTLISRYNCFIFDGLPIVGPAPNVEGLYFALYRRDCGGMIGPALGDLAGRTISARESLDGMQEFSPERFPQSAPGGRKKSFGE